MEIYTSKAGFEQLFLFRAPAWKIERQHIFIWLVAQASAGFLPQQNSKPAKPNGWSSAIPVLPGPPAEPSATGTDTQPGENPEAGRDSHVVLQEAPTRCRSRSVESFYWEINDSNALRGFRYPQEGAWFNILRIHWENALLHMTPKSFESAAPWPPEEYRS